MMLIAHDRLLALRHATPFEPHFGDLEIGRYAADASSTRASDPVSGVLNLFRAPASIREGLSTSIIEGGRWGMRHPPADFVPLVRGA